MSEMSEQLRAIAGVCRDWNMELRKAADEIDRMQAIVDRLPKTADGVPMYVGMKVWVRCENRPDVAFRSFTILDIDGQTVGDVFSRLVKFEDCYSTREAAEKARKS